MNNRNTDSSEDKYLEVKPRHSFLDMKTPSIVILTIIVLSIEVAANVITSLVK